MPLPPLSAPAPRPAVLPPAELAAAFLLTIGRTHARRWQRFAYQLRRHRAGADAGAEDVFADTLLKCHEKIGREGLADASGRWAEAYFDRACERNLARYQEQARATARTHRSLDAPAREGAPAFALPAPPPEPRGEDPLPGLIRQALAERFSPFEQAAWARHLAGDTCQAIAADLGVGDPHALWRRLQKMKKTLREAFAADYAAGADPFDFAD
ncbi:hypothetical protein [Hymenobacter sp.]|uniref:hypothetical protein n=1 Tax=Hymenobacter sp. TaxID=1898978 RepID=UPI00286C604E|nr:hypothetical protein [Hymenobacter sp.]